MNVVALATCIFAVSNVDAQKAKRAVAAIEALGGVVMYDTDSKLPIHVDLNLKQLKATDLVHLKHLPTLKVLELERTGVDDEGLANIGTLRNLEELFLGDNPITSAGMAHISHLTRLKTLDLHKTKVGDVGIQKLKPLAKLNFLWLQYTQVTDAGLATISEMQHMKDLVISGRDISDRGLANLRRLKTLKYLSLIDTSVTNDGVMSLEKALPELMVVR